MEPSQGLVKDVADYIRGVLDRLVSEGFKDYPRLLAAVASVVRHTHNVPCSRSSQNLGFPGLNIYMYCTTRRDDSTKDTMHTELKPIGCTNVILIFLYHYVLF